MAKANPRVTSPPTRNRIRRVRNTVSEVMMVRLSVAFTERLIISALRCPLHDPAVFPDTIKDNHGVIHGKSDHGQDRRNEMLVDL